MTTILTSHSDFRLCAVVIIALPLVTPSKYKNPASYALGDFTNRESRWNHTGHPLNDVFPSERVAKWIRFYS